MLPTRRLSDLRRDTQRSKGRALLPYLLLPFFAFLVVSPTLGRFLVGLPTAWAYAHTPGQVQTLTVTRKWQEQTGRHSFDNFVQLQAASGESYTAQIGDGGFWTQLGETRRVTGQVWQAGNGQGQVMWLRDGSAQAQTEDNPASRSQNALFALVFLAVISLIAAWRWRSRR